MALRADLRRQPEADQLVAEAVAGLGGLHVCVANAGSGRGAAHLGDDIREVGVDDRLNLSVTFHTVAAFLRHVRSTGRGNVVLIGSTAGFSVRQVTPITQPPRSALTGLLDQERGCSPRCGRPGQCGRSGMDGDPDDRRRQVGPELDGAGDRDHAVEEAGRPEDVAAVVWLASDLLAGHVTGHVITVAGMEGRIVP